MRVSSNEATLHQQVVNYIRTQYPEVLFRTDMGGVRLTPGQARHAATLQAGRAFPDFFLYEPRGSWHGLALEFKREGTTIILRDGTLTKNPHIREQYDVLIQLRKLGYMADFAVGFDAAKSAIDSYMQG